MQWQTNAHSSTSMHIPTRISTCYIPFLESSSTPSHMHLPCMKNCFQNKIFLFLKTHWSISYIIYWTTLQYNLLDILQENLCGQPSDKLFFFFQKRCYTLTPVSRDVPVDMKCGISFHTNSCYMHDEYHMKH